MELNTPEERIAAAIWSPADADFRDVCNAIRLQVQRETEQAQLEALTHLMTREAHDRASGMYLRNLIVEKRNSVDQLDTRIRLMREAKNGVRPIRP